MQILLEISECLQSGDDARVAELTRQAIEGGIPPKEILDGGLISGMEVVGERFRRHEIFLPNVLLSAKAMYAGMDLLKPLMIEEGIPYLGRVVIGTVQGDMHDIGKNLVGIMLKGAGFEVIDLGKDVSPESFVNIAVEKQASIIGMSALLTTTMSVMADVVKLLKERGLGGKIKTIIGGAPVNTQFAGAIGADAYGFDGANAVEKVKELIGAK